VLTEVAARAVPRAVERTLEERNADPTRGGRLQHVLPLERKGLEYILERPVEELEPWFRDSDRCMPVDPLTGEKRVVPFATVNTKIHSYKAQEKIQDKLNADLPLSLDDYKLIKKWGYVPDRRRKLRELSPQERERLLNLPPQHVSGVVNSFTGRFSIIGQTFDPDVVAWNLEGLQDVDFGGELVVLSLFDGCGSARVALDKLDVPVRKYFAVEIEQECKNILPTFYNERGWPTAGHLFNTPRNILDEGQFYSTKDSLRKWIEDHSIQPGKLLVIGGSPCDNMPCTNNRVSSSKSSGAAGLEGDKSKLFFAMTRILKDLYDLLYFDDLPV